MKKGYIYKITNKLNGMWYIGSRKIKDIDSAYNDSYMGSGIAITAAIKKYGKENFVKEILCFTEDRFLIEGLLLESLDAKNNKNSYNITNEAGCGPVLFGKENPRYGKDTSEKQKDRAREANIGNKHKLGWKAPESTRLKQSKSQSGERNANYGKIIETTPIWCYETKKLYPNQHQAALEYGAKHFNAKCINNPKESFKGLHWCTDLSIFDGLELTKNKEIPIYCYETKQKFNSIKDAAKYIGCNFSTIQPVINKSNRSVFGLHYCTDLSLFDGKKLTNGFVSKKVLCVDTGVVYLSAAEACKILSIDRATMSVALNKGKKAKGLCWEYVID